MSIFTACLLLAILFVPSAAVWVWWSRRIAREIAKIRGQVEALEDCTYGIGLTVQRIRHARGKWFTCPTCGPMPDLESFPNEVRCPACDFRELRCLIVDD